MIAEGSGSFNYREEDETPETSSDKIKKFIEFVSKFVKEMGEPQKPAAGKSYS